MPSYMTIVVIALAASNVSAALPVSVPVHSSREVREQSLSRRDPPVPPNTPPPPPTPPDTTPHGYPPPNDRPPHHPLTPADNIPYGYPPPNYHPPEGTETKPLLPENSVPSDKVQAEPPKTDVPPPKGGGAKRLLMQFVVGASATMVGASILKAIAGAFSSSKHAAGPAASTSPPSSPANQNSQSDSYPPSYTSSSTSSGQYGQYGSGVGPGQYYQKQQRDVDHDKRADSFEAKARSIFDNNRRATSHLELLTRADLGEALKLFARVLDELD